jgi:hypothetical protein
LELENKLQSGIVRELTNLFGVQKIPPPPPPPDDGRKKRRIEEDEEEEEIIIENEPIEEIEENPEIDEAEEATKTPVPTESVTKQATTTTITKKTTSANVISNEMKEAEFRRRTTTTINTPVPTKPQSARIDVTLPSPSPPPPKSIVQIVQSKTVVQDKKKESPPTSAPQQQQQKQLIPVQGIAKASSSSSTSSVVTPQKRVTTAVAAAAAAPSSVISIDKGDSKKRDTYKRGTIFERHQDIQNIWLNSNIRDWETLNTLLIKQFERESVDYEASILVLNETSFRKKVLKELSEKGSRFYDEVVKKFDNVADFYIALYAEDFQQNPNRYINMENLREDIYIEQKTGI